MKLTSKILLLASLLFMLSACGGPRKIEGNFSAEELGWLVYNDGDNFLFQNPDSAGDEVTLFVTSFKDPAQLRNYYPIEAEVTLSNPEKGEVFKLYLLKDETEFKRYLKVDDVYRSFDLVEPIGSFSVGDNAYEDVYVFKADSMANGNTISNVYYARNHGIVQYETYEGKTYQLLNNNATAKKP
jgi:hypothetical protein